MDLYEFKEDGNMFSKTCICGAQIVKYKDKWMHYDARHNDIILKKNDCNNPKANDSD